MCNIAIVILLTFLTEVHTKDSFNNLVDRLVDQTLQSWPLQHADLDSAALAKPGHLGVTGASQFLPIQCRWQEHGFHEHMGDVRTMLQRGAIWQRGSRIRVRAMGQDEVDMEECIKVLEQQMPLLTDSKLLAKEVLYSCPLAYGYGRSSGSEKTPGNAEYSSKISRDIFIDLMDEVRQRGRLIDGYKMKAIRSFRPERNLLICQWKASYGAKDRPTIVQGSSRYTLTAGKVNSIKETWDTNPEGDGDVFFRSLTFQLSRRPVRTSKYSLDGFVAGYKYAFWESVKNDRNFYMIADDVTREDIDLYSPYLLYASICLGGADIILLSVKLLKTLLLTGLH